MKILVGNVFSKFEGSKKEENFISENLSFRVPQYQYTKAYKKGWWDGRKRLFNKRTKTFPTGLTPFVCKISKKDKFEVSLIGRRKKPKSSFHKIKLNKVELRDYQLEAIDCALDNKLNNLAWSRGVFHLCTGSGKTLLAAGLIQKLGLRTLYLVQRLDLLYQTRDVLANALRKRIGLWGGNKIDLKNVTVATVQTVFNSLDDKPVKEYFAGIDVLMIDECHHMNDYSYYSIATAVNAFYRYGFSGTPLKRGDLGDIYLIASLGEVLYQLRSKELVDRGLLAEPTVKLCEITSPPIPNYTKYQAVYHVGIVYNLSRNLTIVAEAVEAIREGRTVLILVKQLAQGKELNRLLKEAGYSCIFLKGADAIKDRRQYLKSFKRGEQKLIIASTIFDEGINIPSVDCLILASGGASEIKTIQRVGRGMRKKKGDNTLLVIDFIDRTHKYLLKHSLNRLETYQNEQFKIVRGRI